MLVGVVVALGLMILRFIFSFYLLYLCLLLSLLCLQRWGESPKSQQSQGMNLSLGQRSYMRLCYTSNWPRNHELWECDVDQSSVCPVCSILRVLFLKGWKVILTNECTGWVQEGAQEYSVRILINCGVSNLQWVLYVEYHSVLKQLLQTDMIDLGMLWWVQNYCPCLSLNITSLKFRSGPVSW